MGRPSILCLELLLQSQAHQRCSLSAFWLHELTSGPEGACPHREVAYDDLGRRSSPSLGGIFILAWDGWGQRN